MALQELLLLRRRSLEELRQARSHFANDERRIDAQAILATGHVRLEVAPPDVAQTRVRDTARTHVHQYTRYVMAGDAADLEQAEAKLEIGLNAKIQIEAPVALEQAAPHIERRMRRLPPTAERTG